MPLIVQPEPEPVDKENAALLRRGSWVRLGVFMLAVLFAVLLVAGLSRSLPAPAVSRFDTRALALLKRLRPDFVLVGNSMVETRFDQPTLRRLLRPRGVAVIGLSGAKSAVWYLTLKNVVIASGYHPRVIQFFRQGELTEPRSFTTTSRGRQMIAQLSVGNEPLLERKLAPPLGEPIARLEWYRERQVPLERVREKTEPLLDAVGELVSRLLWQPADSSDRKRQINGLFSLSNLRASDVIREPTAPDEAYVFKDVVQQSFLPDMCQLARDNGIALTFVRVRTRVAASGGPKGPGEQRYDTDLERYLHDCGAEFYDMHDAAWESIDMFGSGDHIAGRYKRAYTALFVEHMGQIFH